MKHNFSLAWPDRGRIVRLCSLAPVSLDANQHSSSSLKVIRGNRGHGIHVRACYVQGVLPFALSPQRHPHKGPEGFPLCGGLPDSPGHQWGLHCRGQQHRYALPVLPAPPPDEEVQLWGESCCPLCLGMPGPGWCLVCLWVPAWDSFFYWFTRIWP